jgi:hypothetical protein
VGEGCCADDRGESFRGLAQRLVLVVGQGDPGGRDVPLELFDAGGARDGRHGGVPDDPGQRDLRGGRGVRVRDLAEHGDQLPRPLEVLRQEQRIAGADAVRGPARTPVPARQQPLGQRAVGDHDAAVRCRERQQITLGLPVHEAVGDLVAEDPAAERLLGGAPALQPVVADPDLADQAHPLQGPHAPHDRAVADDRVGHVDLVQIEQADAEPVRAGHGALFHHRSHRQDRKELGRDERRLSATAERGTEEALAAAVAVDLGGIEESDAQLQRAADDCRRFPSRVAFAVAPLAGAELPGAQADLGDLLGRVDVQVAHEYSLRPRPTS